MAQVKVIGGEEYKLVKQTTDKKKAHSAEDAYKRDFNVRMEKRDRVYYVWARRK